MLQINQTLSSRCQAPSRRSARAPTTGRPRSYVGSRKWRSGLTGGRYSGMWGVAASEADREGMVARLTPSRHHELAMVSTIQKSSNLSSVVQSHSIMRHSVDTQGIASSRCQYVRGYCQANRNACVVALEPSTSTIGRSGDRSRHSLRQHPLNQSGVRSEK
jgi:hypothetical protein